MKREIEQHSQIKREDLLEEAYFESLLDAAFAKGLLPEVHLQRIQSECISLLGKKTEKFLMGDSSSIPMEKASHLMDSIFFTLSLWCKRYSTPSLALEDLQKEPVESFYQRGRKRIDTVVSITKIKHQKLLHALIKTQNTCYKETLKEGILGFFKLYDPEFSAQEIHITADYPLFYPMTKLKGIEFIADYLEKAHCENSFCAHFSPKAIHRLLLGYDRNYESLIFNLYEPILLSCIGCVLVKKEAISLSLTKGDLLFLTSTFSHREEGEIERILKYAIALVHQRIHFKKELYAYLLGSVSVLTPKIKIAAKNDLLHQIFVVAYDREATTKMTFTLGKKMDNDLYKKLVEEIFTLKTWEEKKKLIEATITSLEDLIDISKDAHLTKEEILVFISQLGLQELAVLSKYFSFLFPLVKREENPLFEQGIFEECLHRFLFTLPKDKQALLEEVVHSLTIG